MFTLGKIKLLFICICATVFSACGGVRSSLFQGITPTATTSANTPSSINLSPTRQSVGVGDALPLLATVQYSDGTTSDVSNSANWYSSPQCLVTIDSRGHLSYCVEVHVTFNCVVESLQ